MGNFFTTVIAQPIFNLLVLIYALLPGHNLGIAIIIFTAVVRLALWPLLHKQLHQTKKMRRLQPELKRIKQEAKGDRQKESQLMMALYKEHGVSPFGSIWVIIIQLPILIALYQGLGRVVHDPHQIISFAYPWLQHLPWMERLASNIHLFDKTFIGIIDLTKAPLGTAGVYWPAMIIALGSAVVQYFQSSQLLVTNKNTRSIRAILRDAGNGKETDQAEMTAAVGGMTRFIVPFTVLYVTVRLPAALGLYWLVGGLIAYGQQYLALREDETELETLADKQSPKDVAAIREAELVQEVDKIVKGNSSKPNKPKGHKRNKRRKK